MNALRPKRGKPNIERLSEAFTCFSKPIVVRGAGGAVLMVSIGTDTEGRFASIRTSFSLDNKPVFLRYQRKYWVVGLTGHRKPPQRGLPKGSRQPGRFRVAKQHAE